MNTGIRLVTALAALTATAATAALPSSTAATTLIAQDTLAPPDTGGLPAGFGTLRQDDIAVRLLAAAVQVRVLPLEEKILRLLSPDSYNSLHRLRVSRDREIATAAKQAGVRQPSVFLVTLFAVQDRAPFTQEDIIITSRNRMFRPVAILPISPNWSSQQLEQRQTAIAVYVYEEGIALHEPFTVSYAGVNTDSWRENLRLLDQERARVLARATAPRPPDR